MDTGSRSHWVFRPGRIDTMSGVRSGLESVCSGRFDVRHLPDSEDFQDRDFPMHRSNDLYIRSCLRTRRVGVKGSVL